MAFFEWRDEYSVGIKKIDDQHQEIVNHLNNLFQSMKDGKGKDTLDNVLMGLVQYTKAHFSNEENLMKLYKYPGYEEHKQKHKKMTEHVVRLKKNFIREKYQTPFKLQIS
jgi:hemerythrin